jgi:hypothetical protein
MNKRQIRFLAILFLLSLAALACSLTTKKPQPEPALLLPTEVVNVAPTNPLPVQPTQTAPPAATSQPAQPIATPQPTLLTAEPVFQIDRTDLKSVAQGFLWMLENRNAAVLADIIDKDYFYLTNNPIEGGIPYQKDEILSELQKRLDNSGQISCLGFHQDLDGLKIWTTGWNPKWVMTEFCYDGCAKMDPGLFSEKAAFVFISYQEAYILRTIFLSDYDQAYSDPFGDETILPCDPKAILDPSSFSMPAPACRGLLPTRLKINGFAYVSTDPPIPNRVRSGPGKSYEVVGQINPGKGMEIIDGPRCANGMVWWQVVEFGTGLLGWTAEGDQDGYWLVPCKSREGCGK